MSTTTLRLPDDLRARIAQAAFEAVADERYARILESGKILDWQDVRGYLQARTAGHAAVRPSADKKAVE